MDRYEVKRKIGQGSFGSVHLAVHRKSRKNLVIKVQKICATTYVHKFLKQTSVPELAKFDLSWVM
jgi:serine/threonine protein kinase